MRKKIINFLKRRQGRFFKKRELANLIGIRKPDYGKYRRVIKELIDEGEIIRIRGRGYAWAGEHEKLIGKLICFRKGFGFVEVEDGEDIFVSSRNLKGAIHGDIVEVAIVPFLFGTRKEGYVTRIIERNTDEFIGTVIYQRGAYYLEIEPATPRRGIRIIEPSPVKFKTGDVVLAKVKHWGRERHPIQVEVAQVIGSINNPEDDMKIVCRKFDLNPKFPKSVVGEARRFNSSIIAKEIPNRTDLRSLTCITIDPVDARDFDDAISLNFDDEGNSIVGIHISDVSFFVSQGSELDREAFKRGTSVYFAEGVVHMLPDLLSANLCSLVPGKDRLAISVLITLNTSAEIYDVSFHQSVISNKRRFSYREVQSILNGEKKSEYSEMLKKLKSISRELYRQRQAMGSIDFDIPEPIFRFRNGGVPHEIHPSERLESHRIVEELMLLANRLVAENVPKTDGTVLPFIYRIHDKPTLKDVERFIAVLKYFHLYEDSLKELTQNEFRKILATVENSPYKELIENLALRTMTKAIYSTDNRGHYGLAFPNYTHFTSPIRRYPDLVVHRILKKYVLNAEKNHRPIKTEYLGSIAKQSTEAEIKAMEAERDYIKLKQIRWLSQHIGEKFDGIISGVISSGLFVELEKTMVEGFVSVDWLDDDFYEYDEMRFSLVGTKYKRKFQMGDRVRVKIQDVILEKRQANFVIIK